MKYATALFALVATVVAQGPGGSVTADVAPDSDAPEGCQTTFNNGGTFTFTTRNLTSSSKRDMQRRQTTPQVACGGSLTVTLEDGRLLDAQDRVGYIASNRQFQFDGPPQAGAIYTAGFSVCSNNSLALGGSYIFYNCLSGTFSNIYDESQGGQCYPVTIETTACADDGSSASVSSSPSTASSTSVATEQTSAPATSAPAATSVVVAPIGTGISNSTAPVPTGTGASPTTIAPTSSPSPFTGAGAIVAAGQKILGLAAAGAAFALL